MSFKRVMSIMAVVAMVGTMMVGCGSTESTEATTEATTEAATEAATEEVADDDGLLIYGIYKAGDQTWFIDEGAAAQAAVEAAGGEFIYVDANMDAATYLEAIENAIANQADGIVTCTPDQTMSQAVIDLCDAAGIPIVAADDALQDDDGNLLAPWVGIDGYVIGEANGEWTAEYVVENGLVDDDSVAMLSMTMDTVSSCVPRSEGIYDKFTELVPEWGDDRIFYADYDGTTDEGNTVAAAIITAHPEITTWVVVCANEEGAIGALRAIESAGLDDTSCVVGLGAYMAKDEWNNYGSDTAIKASAYFSSDSVGGGSVEVLLQMIDGEDVEMSTAVPAIVVTPDNYVEVMGSYAE